MKKSFWKVIMTLIACLCLCFGLAACGEKEEPPVGDNNTQTEQGGGAQGGNQSGGSHTEQPDDDPTPPPHTHVFSEQWESDETSHWHAATCGDSEISGKAAHTYVNGVCSTCNHAHEEHTFAAYTADDERHTHSCLVCYKEESGTHTYQNGVCTECNHAHENHTFGNWVEKDLPTCTADGYQEHTCSVCGKSERQTLTHAGHTYDKGVCSVCGSVEGLIAFRTLQVSDDDTVYGKVSNNTQTFSFIQEVIAADNVTFTVSYDLGGLQTIPSKTVSLSIGSNTYYILASRGNLLKLYTVTVRRRPVYNVSFETSGSAVSSQQVEEDQDIVQPAATTRTGYTFRNWTLGGAEATFPYKADEGIPQTGGYNVTFTAVFAANDYKATLDAKGGEVAKGEQTVTFDQSYNFPVPTRTGYSFTGWYEGENQLTNAEGASLAAWTYAEGKQLDAHWSANSYKLTVDRNLSDAGTVTGGGMFAYDSDVTVTATTNKGYNFLGWYNEKDERVSERESYTFPMGLEQTITAKWDFYTVTVSRNDTAAGTLSQNYNEEKISAGEQVSITATTNLGYTFLGWYSGDTELTTDKTYSFTMKRENLDCEARWKVSPEMENFIFTSDTTFCTITGIKDKTVTEIIIPKYITRIGDRAFYDCSRLTGELKIPDSVKSIGQSAFSGCSGLDSVTIESGCSIDSWAFSYCGLTSVTIGSGGTLIGSWAFSYCGGLTSVTIGSGTTSIRKEAFGTCQIRTVYYKGTPADWDSVDIYLVHSDYRDGNWNLKTAPRYYYSAETPSAEQWAESPNWWHYEADGETIVLWTKEQA